MHKIFPLLLGLQKNGGTLKDEMKDIRNSVISKFKNIDKSITRKLFMYDSQAIYDDFYDMYVILDLLAKLVIKFDEKFSNRKKEKNIVDFNDIEHFAMKILRKPEVAQKYRDKFVEIAIDEYQDSNQVQECIINLISIGNNTFMVGDVKQSIYKFRQACPKLFLEKYNNYSLEGNDKGKKIKLFKNFRSKKNVLDITNLVFENIMSSTLGDNVDYTEEEYLNLGANYEDIPNGLDNAEIDIIDMNTDNDMEQEVKNNDYNFEFGEDDDKEEVAIPGVISKAEIESRFIARKIKELIDSKVMVQDRKGLREITYKDIVILLRSTKDVAAIYEKELINNDIPVFSDGANEYLDTIEIQTMISVLRMLDNPLDDIAIVSSMRSIIGDFNDNELLEIRLFDRNCSFYDSLILASEKTTGKLKKKIDLFIHNIKNWKRESEYISLAELIWKICLDTGFYNYVGLMPNGSLRQANLKLLFEVAKEYEKTSFAGIYNFIKFVEKLKTENGDMSSAKIIGENENVVRIMSIHKSKGLEFPVVILANASKQFNFKDFSSELILHQELGFGPDYINYETMKKYAIIAKEAVKIRTMEEAIAEEMRILYVALTRAKEKLIITGTVKDFEKMIKKNKEALNIDSSSIKESKKISSVLLKNYKTYLDWLELIYLKNESYIKENNIVKINCISAKELMKNQDIEEKVEVRNFDFDEYTDFESLDKKFSWEYTWKDATVMPIKTTVSKIKEDTSVSILASQSLENKKTIDFTEIPDFMRDNQIDEKTKGARKGTITHMLLQFVDFKGEITKELLEKLKDTMLVKGAITEKEHAEFDLSRILNFVNSDLGKMISSCSIIEKEKPFCIKIKINEEDVLVQGIIDLYAIKENGEIILVDYKTDFAENENELKDKYAKQLELYRYALENNYNKKVTDVYLYSLYLGKAIKL